MQPSTDMQDGAAIIAIDDVFTLLGVRRDGVASVVDLQPGEVADARRRAQRLLHEHDSCVAVEIWRDGSLIEKVARP
jgi:hypothetical protein